MEEHLAAGPHPHASASIDSRADYFVLSPIGFGGFIP
jgi:hypothetical protein